MSRRHAEATLFTLKVTVPPRFTLMSVAKPWIPLSPEPEISQVPGGVPGRQFSASVALAGALQEACAGAGKSAMAAATIPSVLNVGKVKRFAVDTYLIEPPPGRLLCAGNFT